MALQESSRQNQTTDNEGVDLRVRASLLKQGRDRGNDNTDKRASNNIGALVMHMKTGMQAQ